MGRYTINYIIFIFYIVFALHFFRFLNRNSQSLINNRVNVQEKIELLRKIVTVKICINLRPTCYINPSPNNQILKTQTQRNVPTYMVYDVILNFPTNNDQENCSAYYANIIQLEIIYLKGVWLGIYNKGNLKQFMVYYRPLG